VATLLIRAEDEIASASPLDRPRGRRSSSRWQRVGVRVLATLALLGLWQLLYALQLIADDPDTTAAVVGRQLGISPEELAGQLSQGIFLAPADEASAEYLGTSGAPGRPAENLRSAGEFLVDQQQVLEAPSLESLQDALYTEGLTDDVAG
jgi:hypothetical protein